MILEFNYETKVITIKSAEVPFEDFMKNVQATLGNYSEWTLTTKTVDV